jgi:hypothetical protein
MGFAVDIQNFVKKCGVNADIVTRKVVLDIGKSLVDKTPVGDAEYWAHPAPPGYVGGHARANWSHSEGAHSVKEFDGVDKTGESSNARIAASVPTRAAGKVHFIQNSVPYIERLEDGHSRQAPNGMVALTQIEFKNFIQNALAGLK